MKKIWENGVAIAKVEERDNSFSCLKFSKRNLRLQNVFENLDQNEIESNLKKWKMRPTNKILTAVEK